MSGLFQVIKTGMLTAGIFCGSCIPELVPENAIGKAAECNKIVKNIELTVKEITEESIKEKEKASDVFETGQIVQSELITEPVEEPEPISEEPEELFEYAAIGNSVTCNEPCDYWWGHYGMAASAPEKDYVHQVKDYIIQTTNVNVDVKTGSIKEWETAEGSRDAMFSTFDGILNTDTDLVTVQAGENITNHKDSLYNDYCNLIIHIHEKAPNAQIIVLGNVLWDFTDVDAAKACACADTGTLYIDLAEFKTNYDAMYRSYVGAPVVGDDGNIYEIWYDCVAAHPNDAGMTYIAEKIEEQIVFTKRK